MNEKELKGGSVFRFENHTHIAEICYGMNIGPAKTFVVTFNGSVVKATKTYTPVEKKIEQLIEDYNLIRTKRIF